jgi:hypothetical protein
MSVEHVGDTTINDRQRSAIDDMVHMDGAFYTWSDLGPHLSCREAEAVAEFFSAFGADEVAEALLVSHGEDDDEGDEHWTGTGEV